MADLSPRDIRVRDMSFTAELRLQDGRPLSFMRRDGKNEPLEGSFMIAKKDGAPARVYFKWLDDNERPGYSLFERSMPNGVQLGLRLVSEGVRLDNYPGWYFQIYLNSDYRKNGGEIVLETSRPCTANDFSEDEYDVYLRSVGRWTFLESGSKADLGEGYQWMKADDKRPINPIYELTPDELQELSERRLRKDRRFKKWLSDYEEEEASSESGGKNDLSQVNGMDIKGRREATNAFEVGCGLDKKFFESMDFGEAGYELSESEKALKLMVENALSKLSKDKVRELVNYYRVYVLNEPEPYEKPALWCLLKMKVVERKILL